MVTKKSVTTEVFVIRWADLEEYCPELEDLSPTDADDYALAHCDEITRALVAWAKDLSIWDKPDYAWAKSIDSVHWEADKSLLKLLVQFVLC